MEVHIIGQMLDDIPDNIRYKYKPYSYCCQGIKEAIEEYMIIDFNDSLDEYDVEGNSASFKITKNWEDYDGYVDVRYYGIKYCPFCGEKISIIVDKIEYKQNELDKLKQKSKSIKEKCRKEDSKKKAQTLEKQYRDIDRSVDSFYTFGEYINTEDNE